jgi:hypothetical protein
MQPLTSTRQGASEVGAGRRSISSGWSTRRMPRGYGAPCPAFARYGERMRAPSNWLPGALALVAVLACIGVVMADTHVPVAIEPDAAAGKGVAVATFALG